MYFCRDGVHPNSAAYRVCYEHLRETASLNELMKDAAGRNATAHARAAAREFRAKALDPSAAAG